MPPGQSIRWDPQHDELWAVITADADPDVQRRSVELARDETSITWGMDTGRRDCEYEVTVKRCPEVVLDFVPRGDEGSSTCLELAEVSVASSITVGFDIINQVWPKLAAPMLATPLALVLP